jgi:hypothetical protein
MKRDKQEDPDIGVFLLVSVLHFYSGQPLQNLSGVDTPSRMSEKPPRSGSGEKERGLAREGC